MPYTETELVSRIEAAFWATFTDGERGRSPDFEQDIRARAAKIVADRDRISEIECSAEGWDQLEVTILRARIDISWKELVLCYQERGSLADRKFMQFIALLAPTFGVSDFPSFQNSDAKLFMELLLHPAAAAN